MHRLSSRPAGLILLTPAAALAAAAALLALAGPAHAEETLIQPRTLVVDAHLDRAQAEREILAARRYGSFWATGEEALARAALAPDFLDRTLPPGRAQGLAGPLAASAGFRQAVPDLRCEIAQMIVSGDRVVSHLRFTGHFSGQFHGRTGQGQAIDFIATDDRITTNICFGGEDFGTAFITVSSTGQLLRMKWPRKGLRLNHQ